MAFKKKENGVQKSKKEMAFKKRKWRYKKY